MTNPYTSLPNFEEYYRAKTGKNIAPETEVDQYRLVADEDRQRKKGGGRKAKTLHNPYFDVLNSGYSYIVDRNFDDLVAGVSCQVLNKKGEEMLSKQVLKTLLVTMPEVTAKLIQAQFKYGKTQAYLYLDAFKLAAVLNTDLTFNGSEITAKDEENGVSMNDFLDMNFELDG